MGIIERNMIRLLESILDYRWQSRTSAYSAGTDLNLGKVRAAFGRKGSEEISIPLLLRLVHDIAIGGSGTGKTMRALSILLQNHRAGVPYLFLDCHDAIEKLLRILAHRIAIGQISEDVIDNIWLVSPANESWSVAINPLECRQPEKAAIKVAPMMELLRVFWGDALGPQTHEFTQNLLIMLAERQLPLTAAPGLLHDPVALRAHAANLVNYRAREYFLTRFLSWSPSRRTQVINPFLVRTSVFLADPRIAAMLDAPKGDIDFRRAMDERKTILIEINKGQFFDSVGLLASMLLISLQQAAFSRADLPEEERHPYFIVIDEFPSFASSVTVAPFLNESRKFGVGLSLIAQTFASLDRELLSALRVNCYTQVFFRSSPEDAKIATAGLIGEVRDLIARELVSLPTGEALLMLGGGQPRRLQIDRLTIPDRLTVREQEIIERIRRNVGRPLNLAAARPASTAPGGVTGLTALRPVPPAAKPKTAPKITGGFVEGDI